MSSRADTEYRLRADGNLQMLTAIANFEMRARNEEGGLSFGLKKLALFVSTPHAAKTTQRHPGL